MIVTSTFTIVETIRPKWVKPPTALTLEQARILDGMFRWPWIRKFQLDERLALKAVGLARDYWLKPGDAIHAATAIAANVDVLQCWDRDFSAVAQFVSVAQPAYLTPQMGLFQAVDIGPNQQQIDRASATSPASSSELLPPARQSPDDESV